MDTFKEVGTAQGQEASWWTFGLTTLAARTKRALPFGTDITFHGAREQKDPVSADKGVPPQSTSLPIVEGKDEIDRSQTTDREDATDADRIDQKVNFIPEIHVSSVAPGDSSVADSANKKIQSPIFSEDFISTKPSSVWEATQPSPHEKEGPEAVTDDPNNLGRYDVTRDDLQSVASANEEIQSLDGSAIISPSLRWAAVSCIADILTDDPDLGRMYQDAERYLDDDKFLRNHERLLKFYYLRLRSQTVTQAQRLGVEFLRLRIHRRLISTVVKSKTQKADDSTEITNFDLSIVQVLHREETLNRFFDSIVETPGRDCSDDSIDHTESLEDVSESENEDSGDGDESKNGENFSLDNLHEIKTVFRSGQALRDFKQQFHHFLYPDPSVRGEVRLNAGLAPTPTVTFDVIGDRPN